MADKVQVTVAGVLNLSADVKDKKPEDAQFDPTSKISRRQQLSDLLDSGKWRRKIAQVIVWDEDNKQWLLWTAP